MSQYRYTDIQAYIGWRVRQETRDMWSRVNDCKSVFFWNMREILWNIKSMVWYTGHVSTFSIFKIMFWMSCLSLFYLIIEFSSKVVHNNMGQCTRSGVRFRHVTVTKCYLVDETRSLKSKKYFIEGLTLALNCLNR